MTDTGKFHYRVGSDTGFLAEMAQEVEECNRENGWYVHDRRFGEDIALLHSEASEALEAYRDHGMKSFHEYVSEGGSVLVEVGSPNDVLWLGSGPPPKPQGVASELADVLVRLLDTCQRYDVDLFAAWREKVDYNWTRPSRHGGKLL